MTGCVKCLETGCVEHFTGGDEHWRSRCEECGHEWGPFVTSSMLDDEPDEEPSGQSGLGDFA